LGQKPRSLLRPYLFRIASKSGCGNAVAATSIDHFVGG
jgi:hypothetical protein